MINEREVFFLSEFHVRFMSAVRFSSKRSTRFIATAISRYRRCAATRSPAAPSLAYVIHLERPTVYSTYRLSYGTSALLTLRYVAQRATGREAAR